LDRVARLRRHDAAFDHDIGWTADHDQVLDIIAPDKDKPTPCIDRCCIQYLQARLAVFAAPHEGRGGTTPADHPKDADQKQETDAYAQDRDNHATAICANQFFYHSSYSVTLFRCSRRLFTG